MTTWEILDIKACRVALKAYLSCQYPGSVNWSVTAHGLCIQEDSLCTAFKNQWLHKRSSILSQLGNFLLWMVPPLRPWDHIWAEQQMELCSLAGSPWMFLIPAWGFAPATKSPLVDDVHPFSLRPDPGLCTQSSSFQSKDRQMPISQRREWRLQRILPHFIILRGSKRGFQQMLWLVVFVYMK